MDRFEAMRLFVRIVERRSFTQAAADLNLPRSTATEAVQQLEARLGARLAPAHHAPGQPRPWTARPITSAA
ncbi:helix-turn-helix domain-containing protein [Caulobacter segnis]